MVLALTTREAIWIPILAGDVILLSVGDCGSTAGRQARGDVGEVVESRGGRPYDGSMMDTT